MTTTPPAVAPEEALSEKWATNEESNTAANSNNKMFLCNSKGLDVLVISLLVKYYVPLAHFNEVIKLLKFKSAVNLQCF